MRAPREARALFALAAPLAAGELGIVGMAMVDTLFVARLGVSALAALGFGSALQLVVVGCLAGTLSGVTPLVARAKGAAEGRNVASLTMASLVLAVLLAATGTIALAYGGIIARLAHQSPAVVAGATIYLHALAWSVLPTLVFFAARASLEGMGRPRAATAITLAGLAANAAAAALLVPRFGIAGAGVATTVVRWLMAAAMLVWLWHDGLLGERGAAPLPALRVDVWRIVRLGAPIGVYYTLELGVFAVAAMFAGWIGTATLAAWQVAMNAVQTVFGLASAVGSAGAIRVGHARGADAGNGVAEAVRATYRLTGMLALTCGLLFAIAPGAIAHLYTSDVAVISAVTPMFAIAAFFTIVDQLQVCGLTLLHGAADTTAAATIAAAGYCIVGVPIAWWLSVHTELGATGIWIGLGAGAVFASLMSMWRLKRHMAPRLSSTRSFSCELLAG